MGSRAAERWGPSLGHLLSDLGACVILQDWAQVSSLVAACLRCLCIHLLLLMVLCWGIPKAASKLSDLLGLRDA